MTQQIEGVVEADSIRTWMKTNNITLSEDAISKLEQNGFITIEDLQYCSAEEMDKDGKEEMNIKLADRKKLKKAMQIITDDNTNKLNASKAITMMGYNNNNTNNTMDVSDEIVLTVKEGITLMGLTGNIEDKMEEYMEEHLYIGNLHKLSDGKYLYGEEKTAHEWTLFISTSKDKLIEPKSIKQVTYYLHETFNPSTVIIKKPPFNLKKTGWGYFMIKAKIEFHDKYNKKSIFCAHLLDFAHNLTLTHIDKHNRMDIEDDDDDDDDEEDEDGDCYGFYNDYLCEIFHSKKYNHFINQ